jgi:repressor LexA
MIRLKFLREQRGFSQKEFAAEMGLPYTTYNSYETGKRAPDFDMLSRFADYFQVSVDYLLGRSDDPEPEQKQKGPLLPTLAMNLRYYRLASHLSTSQAAKLADVPAGTWLSWEQGKALPSDEELARAAEVIGVSVSDLGRDAERAEETIPGLYPVKKKRFPVLGKVACGEPIFAEEDRETSIMASADINADFCLIAQGDSMTGAHIEDGDIVFIRQMPTVPNGKIAVVLIEDEATLKYIEYRPEQATLILTPANPAFRTQIYTGEELNQIRVLGMAVTLQKDLTRR